VKWILSGFKQKFETYLEGYYRSTVSKMPIIFNCDTIAVFRPTHKEYDFLKYNVIPARQNRWGTIEPPVIEGIHKNLPHTLSGRENHLDFWNNVGFKRLNFTIVGDVLKVAGQDVWIPIIRLSNGMRYTNQHNKLKKAGLANIVAPDGIQIGQYTPTHAPVPAPVPAPVLAPTPTQQPQQPQQPHARTHVFIPSNLPRSMIPHFKDVGQSMDRILTNNTISTQDKLSQIMNKYARSIREVIRTIEQEKEIPQFVAQLVAQRSVEHGDTCPITCDDIIIDDATVTSCFHVFDKISIQTYRNGGNMTCPVCRQHCSITNAV
jgi:hypothetical protein